MGITTIQAKVFNPGDPSHRIELDFVVDSGAAYSVVPVAILQALALEGFGFVLDPFRRELRPMPMRL
jgi:hypothetical protein